MDLVKYFDLEEELTNDEAVEAFWEGFYEVSTPETLELFEAIITQTNQPN